MWDLMYDKKAMFARDLTEDKEIHKDSAYRVCKLSRELKQAIPNKLREMMILKTMWLNQGLDAECVKRAVQQFRFEEDIRGRIDDNFKLNQWCDIVLPINFMRHWVLLICNYEKRELTVAYFMKETGDV